MNVAVILAGGTGSRIGADVPKQFIQVQGKPILAYTMENFQRDEEIHAMEVVCHPEWMDQVRDICKTWGFDKVRWIVSGGETFQDSTRNGVFHLKDKLSPDDILVLSFGVSPFCTPDIINDSIHVAMAHGNGISAEPPVLCTCIMDDACSTTQNLLRETVRGFANPWSFRYGELCQAYETAVANNMLDGLEPHTTSLYLALGKRLWFSKSSGHNFKITLKEDLERFEGLLLLQKSREEAGQTVSWKGDRSS